MSTDANAQIDPESGEYADIVERVIIARKSYRKFLDTPVSRDTVTRILEVASRAPSGTNMQPWKVHVVAGNAKEDLSKAILAAHYNSQNEHKSDYGYYPDTFEEPYKSRRRKIGLDLYGLLGIQKGESEKMLAQHGRNYLFFDAPVGLIFTIDKDLKIGSWLDYGMFLQNIMIVATAHGLGTCPQAAFAKYHRIIREKLDIADDQIVVCGMSLGRVDFDAVENQLETERVPVEGFTNFYNL